MAVTINGTTGIETNTDTGKIKVGASDDISIYHESGNSFIDNSTGDFKIRADNLRIRGKTADEMMISTYVNGTVALAYDGVQQCSTSANGLAFPSGKGIDFSATSDASGKTGELISDYEEGTWTPKLYANGSDSGVTYSSNHGVYTKIGNLIHLRGQINLSDKGDGNSGHAIAIGNFPYTIANMVNGTSNDGAGWMTYWNNWAGSYGWLGFWVQESTTYAYIKGVAGDVTNSNNSANVGNLNDNSEMRFAFTYHVS